MKNRIIKYLACVLFVLIAAFGCYFIIKDANWIFGDNHEFLATTAIGKIESIRAHMGGGRFNPLQHYDYNILTLIPFGTSALAHYILVALSFCLLTFLFAKNSLLIAKKYSISENKIWFGLLFSVFVFVAFLMNPNTAAVFLDIIYPERFMLILFSAFVYFYLSALDSDKKWRYLCAFLCVVWASYMKEVVAGAFLVFALINLLFDYKNMSRVKKFFYKGLILNFIVYVILYYFLVYKSSTTFYNQGRVDLSLVDNIITIFNGQKFLVLMFLFAIYRGIRILLFKDYKHLPFDSLLFMSVAYTGEYFALNLNAGYYFEPAILVGYIVMLYWFIRKFDKKQWGIGISLICALFIVFNSHDAYGIYKHIHNERKAFIPNLTRLINENGLSAFKIYAQAQGNFNDKIVNWQQVVLDRATNYLQHTQNVKYFVVVSDVKKLSKNDIVFVSDAETEQTKQEANTWFDTNDFSIDYKGWWLSIYSKTKWSEIQAGHYEFNKDIPGIKISGVSGIESWGRWSDSSKVTMKFKFYMRKNLKLKFDVMPFLAEKRPYQKVTIFVNNKKKTQWIFENGKTLPETVINISHNDIGKDKFVSIVFDIENPISPKELGVVDDPRKLGIGFKSFEITE